MFLPHFNTNKVFPLLLALLISASLNIGCSKDSDRSSDDSDDSASSASLSSTHLKEREACYHEELTKEGMALQSGAEIDALPAEAFGAAASGIQACRDA